MLAWNYVHKPNWCYPVGPNAGYILAQYLMPNQSFYSANIGPDSGHKETSVSTLILLFYHVAAG
jgi:hypothetical protein